MSALLYEKSGMIVTLTINRPEARNPLGERPEERKRAASAAKVQIGKSARFVGQNAVQIHGGIGMTDELALGHYFKRVTMLDALYGNVDHHLARYASLARKA